MRADPARRRTALVTFAVVGISAVVVLSILSGATPHAKDQIVSALNTQFDSHLDAETLQVRVFPRPEVSGTRLVLRHEGRTDVPPLITIGSFSAGAGLLGLFSDPVRLRDISLSGLDIRIPPGGVNVTERKARPDASDAPDGDGPPAPRPRTAPGRGPILIGRIEAQSARLEILPANPEKLPRVFEIHDLEMDGFGRAEGASFRAALTNPTPRGRIETYGRFGPWHGKEPGSTAVEGQYQFTKADLNTIRGIAGHLSSAGTYNGVLERIEVEGTTDTPDFAVDVAGQPVPLRTRFKAVVDGTNGNTWLERVEARIAESLIVARGAVVRAKDIKGRRVSLDVTIRDARLEDLLKLAVKGAAPVTGQVAATTKFLLPAGEEKVIERLQLEGEFRLEQARFTNLDVQKRIDELSQRARGNTAAAQGGSVVSNLRGRFALRNASLSFSELAFAVPGAIVQLAGSYDLARETMAFTGHLLLDAELAETTSGLKAVVAKVAQPLFKRPGGGSKLPIKIGGTREKPEFGLDVKRALGPGD